MEIKSLIKQYIGLYMSRYGSNALPEQLKALRSMLYCQTPASGELYAKCPDCDHGEWRPLSCGNRHCPQCLNHQTSSWIDKQQEKLMPYHIFWPLLPYHMS